MEFRNALVLILLSLIELFGDWIFLFIKAYLHSHRDIIVNLIGKGWFELKIKIINLEEFDQIHVVNCCQNLVIDIKGRQKKGHFFRVSFWTWYYYVLPCSWVSPALSHQSPCWGGAIRADSTSSYALLTWRFRTTMINLWILILYQHIKPEVVYLRTF